MSYTVTVRLLDLLCRVGRLSGRYPLLANVVGLTFVALPALFINRQHLFHGLDGVYMRQLVRHQHEWMPLDISFASNPLQGMANVFFPFNMNLTPVLAVQAWLWAGEVDPVVSFTSFALELAAAAYLIGAAAGLPLAARLVAAWLLPVFATPFFWPPQFYAVYALVPNCIDLILVEAVLLLLFRRLGDGPAGINLLRAAMVVTVPGWAAVANPLFVMTIAPTLTLGFAMTVALNPTRRRLLWQSGALGAVLVAMVGGGFVEFLVGATFYTVPAFFSEELFRHQAGLTHASIVFRPMPLGRVLVALSVVGAIVAIRREQQTTRWYAWLHLLLTALCVAGGYVIIEYFPGWRGPQMAYFEMSVWPFYFLFATYAVYAALDGLIRAIRHSDFRLFGPCSRLSPAMLLSAIVAIWLVYLYAGTAFVRDPGLTAADLKETAIVRELRAATALQLGGRFKGSVANFAGGDPGKPIHWGHQHMLDFLLWKAAGNDHRLTGLWAFDIPTLQEYNHYLTPPMHLAFTRLLARPTDPQLRNIVAITAPDAAALRAFGARFVLSDRELGADFQLRQTLNWGSGQALHLYELAHPNLGGYSPVRLIQTRNAAEVLQAMKRPIDYESEAVLTDPLAAKLVRATSAELRFIPGGFRVTAESPATSLLVLPVQFSHCLSLPPSEAGAIGARLMRVNLLQAGLVFTTRIDVNVLFRFGPLGHTRCRMQDIADMKALDLKGAARSFPLVLQNSL